MQDNIDMRQITANENLGELVTNYHLTGGRLHNVQYIKTDKGEYVVKILNPNKINVPGGLEKYEKFELIARSFKNNGVNAVHAVHDKATLFPKSGNYYFVYEFKHGNIINGLEMDPSKAFKVGGLLGQMHQTDLSKVVDMDLNPHLYTVNLKTWEEALAHNENIPELNEINPLMNTLNEIHQTCKVACSEHKTSKPVISHGDMDLANIIWDSNDNPWLIDWEYAGKFDATYDLINAALYASETLPGQFDIDRFKSVMEGYINENLPLPKLDQVSESIYLAIAGWMRWINYNWERLESSHNSDDSTLAISQIVKWTKTVIGVYNNYSHFLDAIKEVEQKQIQKQNIDFMTSGKLITPIWNNSSVKENDGKFIKNNNFTN